jgi:hypothetical protein
VIITILGVSDSLIFLGRGTRVKLVIGAVTALLLFPLLPAGVADAAPKAPAGPGDFNGDGKRDFALGMPNLKYKKKARAGAVSVQYAGVKKKQWITQDSAGVAGTVGKNHQFGGALATADFNQDGYADLAVNNGSQSGVTVIYGSAKGLAKSRYLKSSRPLRHLAAGDFDRNGRPDLIGTDRSSYTIYRNLGSGRRFAARTGTSELLPVVGDFTGDGFDDVAFLSQGNEAGNAWATSLPVILARGGAQGLGAPRATGWKAGTVGAAGDFDHDGMTDLITQAPWTEELGPQAGGVQIFRGGRDGLNAPAYLDQNSPGMPGDGDNGRQGYFDGDNFGGALAAGDTDKDGYADVVIGAPGEDRGNAREAGDVTVLHGSRNGLTVQGATVLTKPGKAAASDFFGAGLSLKDYTGDGRADLLVTARQLWLFRSAAAAGAKSLGAYGVLPVG